MGKSASRTAVAVVSCFAILMGWATATRAAEEKTKPEYVFKLATLAPKGIGWARQFELILLPEMERCSDGLAAFKCYWGGIMGDDEDVLKKMRIDQIQAAGITGQGATTICPAMNVLELPFMFNDYGEVDYLKEKMYATFDTMAQENGFKLIYWLDQDFDQIYSTQHDMDTLSDFRDSRFMTWYGPLEEACLEELGVSPIPLNGPEVASAVRQHVVNALIAPAMWVIGTQTHSVFRYVNPVRIRYAPALAVFTTKAYFSIPPKYRKRIEDNRKNIEDEFCAQVRKENKAALDALIEYGLEETRMTDEELAVMRDKAIVTWELLAGEYYTRETLDEIKAHLATYRAEHP